MLPELITLNEFAACVGKSRVWVYRRIGTGTIPEPLQVGGTKRWNRKVVEKWLEELAKPQKKNPPRVVKYVSKRKLETADCRRQTAEDASESPIPTP